MTRQPIRSVGCWKREHGSSIACGPVLAAIPRTRAIQWRWIPLGRSGSRAACSFEQARAEVSPDGRRELASFARDYFPLLLQDEDFRDQLKRIVVEGHTNDDGTYELNLGLSHDRSLAVMLVLLEEARGL